MHHPLMHHPRPCRDSLKVSAPARAAVWWMAVCGLLLAGGGCATPAKPLVTAEISDLGYVPVWATNLGVPKGQRVNHAVVLDDLVMIAEAPEPRLTAVELDTGKIRWRRKLGDGVFPLSRPHRRGDEILVVQDASRIAIIDADNAEVKTYQDLGNAMSSEPVLFGDVLLYGSLNGIAIAHNLNIGFPTWRYALPYQIVARPVVEGDRVVFADEGGTYAMLDAVSGSLMWRGRAFEGITGTPAITNAAVFLPSEDGTLYALDALNGEDLWVHHTTTPLTEPVTKLGQNLYLPVPGQALRVLDPLSGEVLWEAPASYRPVRLREGELLVYDGRSLHVLDPDDGRVMRSAASRENVQVLDAPDGNLLIVGENGRLLRLDDLK